MDEDVTIHYPKFIDFAIIEMHKTPAEAMRLDKELWEIGEYVDEQRNLALQGLSDTSQQELDEMYPSLWHMFWIDNFGEETWDNRHELYKYTE